MTKEEFKTLTEEVKKTAGYREPIGFGICRVDRGQLDKSKILQATFPIINWKENFGTYALFFKCAQMSGNPINSPGSEAIVKINKEFVAAAMEAYAPYLAEAKGNDADAAKDHGDDGDNLDQGEPELEFTESLHRYQVDRAHAAQRRQGPDPARYVGEPDAHVDGHRGDFGNAGHQPQEPVVPAGKEARQRA